jgi:tol-pal system protein YbgF
MNALRRSTLRLAPLALALGLAACASTPPEEDPVQVRLNDLDTRLARIERVVNNQSLVALGQRIDALESDVRSERGQLEELQNGAEGVRKQQRDLYADLDRRLAALEVVARGGAVGAPVPAPLAPAGSAAAGATATGPAPGAAAAGPAGALAPATLAAPQAGTAGLGTPAEQAAYNRAFDLLKGSNYPAAVDAFKGFLTSYPLSDLASNAQYWLGETYYVTRDYDNALSAFQRVVRDWPSSRKAPDALVKLGYTQAELKRFAAARSTLNLVIAQYPGTDAAKLAEDRLAKLPAP